MDRNFGKYFRVWVAVVNRLFTVNQGSWISVKQNNSFYTVIHPEQFYVCIALVFWGLPLKPSCKCTKLGYDPDPASRIWSFVGNKYIMHTVCLPAYVRHTVPRHTRTLTNFCPCSYTHFFYGSTRFWHNQAFKTKWNNTQSFLIIVNSISEALFVQVLQYYCVQESILFSLSHTSAQVFDNFIIRYPRDLYFFFDPHTKIRSSFVKSRKQLTIYIEQQKTNPNIIIFPLVLLETLSKKCEVITSMCT